jgi:hypothetical protein
MLRRYYWHSCLSILMTSVSAYLTSSVSCLPMPVAARSNAWVCGRSFAGIPGSDHAGAWMSVSCECCVLSGRGPCVGLVALPGVLRSVTCL